MLDDEEAEVPVVQVSEINTNKHILLLYIVHLV